MEETTVFFSVSHKAAGYARVQPVPRWPPARPGKGVQLPPVQRVDGHKPHCRKTHFAFNLIFFTYLKSLNQRILPKKGIDHNEIIRSSKMIWSSSQSCSRLRIRSQMLFFGKLDYQPLQYKGWPFSLVPNAQVTHTLY